MSEGKFDPHRRLCPDGSCVGVIGDDGRCRVCGRSAGGGSAGAGAGAGKDDEPAPTGGFAPTTFDDDDADDADDADADDGESRAAAGGGGFDPHRKLCPDGDCLGVIGADGVCNVCGKKAE